MTQALRPPPTLACRRVLEFAVLGESASYSGHSNLFRGDSEVGPVPCLAICQDAKGTGVLVLHCDRDWTILGIEARVSLQDAKSSAEETYAGVSSLWVDAHVTEEEAAKHVDEILGGQRCSLCKRTPLDFQGNHRFIQKNDAWVCEYCVKTCYELLQMDEQGV